MNQPLQSMTALVMITALALPLPAWASDPCATEKGNSVQKTQYCDAAKAAEESADGQQAVGIIQAAAAATCISACLLSPTGTGEMVCQGASIGATVATIGVGIKYQEYVSSLASSLATLSPWFFNGIAYDAGVQGFQGTLMDLATETVDVSTKKLGIETKFNETASNRAGEKAAQNDNTGCYVAAAIHGLTSTVSFVGAQNSKEKADENRDSARKLIDQALAAEAKAAEQARRDALNTEAIGNPNSGVAPPGYRGTTTAYRPGAAGGFGGGSFAPSMNFNQMVNFALAQPGNNLPGFVRSPQFRAELERNSGMSADQLVRLGDPTKIMQAGVAKLLKPEGQARLAEIGGRMQSLARQGAPERRSQMLAATPREKPQADPRAEAAYEAIQTKAAAGDKPAGELVPIADRLLSSVAGDEENPSISIFVRVSSRYHLAWGKVGSNE